MGGGGELAALGAAGVAAAGAATVAGVSGYGSGGAAASLAAMGAVAVEEPEGEDAVTAAVEEVVQAGVDAGGSFFDGAFYTPKVLTQMDDWPGEFHSFPEEVGAFEDSGEITPVTGGDGIQRLRLRIPGSYLSSKGNWYSGMFEWIKDPDGAINHRDFVASR